MQREINKIKAAKAPGTDGILKCLSPAWVLTIATLFNSESNSDSYPNEWSVAQHWAPSYRRD